MLDFFIPWEIYSVADFWPNNLILKENIFYLTLCTVLLLLFFFSNSFHRIESVWVSENRYYPFNRLDRIVPFVCLILHFHRRSGPFRHTNIDCIWSDMHSIQVRSQVSLDTIRDLHSKPIVVTHSSTFFISRRTRFHQSLFWIIIIISQDIIAGRLKVHFFSLKILN